MRALRPTVDREEPLPLQDRLLPTTGTLTFLFTDIEGSTRRWAEHPETMSAALVGHDELLRGAIESHGGGVFKHMGDGVSAVFATPYDALTAAVTAPQSLQSESWGAIGDLPVRMGIRGRVATRSGAVEGRDGPGGLDRDSGGILTATPARSDRITI